MAARGCLGALKGQVATNDAGDFYYVSTDLLKWAVGQNLDMALINPGKPWQNSIAESLNGKFRDECLSMEWFRNRTEA